MPTRCRRLISGSVIAVAAVLANESSAEILVTDTTRLLFTTDQGNLVFQSAGDFEDSLSDAHGGAAQETMIDSAGFSGLLTAALDTAAPAEDKQAVSQLIVEFTVGTPQLVTLSVPVLASEISDPAPTVFTNGALLALGDELTNAGEYDVFLLDNGGDFGQLEPPLEAFESNLTVLGLVDTFVLEPGEYAFGAQTVVTARQGAAGTGVSVVGFQVAFTEVPETATVALANVGLGAACFFRRRFRLRE